MIWIYLDSFQVKTFDKKAKYVEINQEPESGNNVEYIVGIAQILTFTRRDQKTQGQVEREPAYGYVV